MSTVCTRHASPTRINIEPPGKPVEQLMHLCKLSLLLILERIKRSTPCLSYKQQQRGCFLEGGRKGGGGGGEGSGEGGGGAGTLWRN